MHCVLPALLGDSGRCRQRCRRWRRRCRRIIEAATAKNCLFCTACSASIFIFIFFTFSCIYRHLWYTLFLSVVVPISRVTRSPFFLVLPKTRGYRVYKGKRSLFSRRKKLGNWILSSSSILPLCAKGGGKKVWIASCEIFKYCSFSPLPSFFRGDDDHKFPTFFCCRVNWVLEWRGRKGNVKKREHHFYGKSDCLLDTNAFRFFVYFWDVRYETFFQKVPCHPFSIFQNFHIDFP